MLKQYCQEKCLIIDEALARFIPDHNVFPPIIFEAMRYSLFAGGKRLRPIMLMAAADAVGGDGIQYLNVACGLEMIHTYSLIHDDLPAMDNDDYRRGKLTSHKVFGDGMAVLAGDALLTDAFTTMLSQPDIEAEILLKVIKEISIAAGAKGMIGGQVIDLSSEGKTIDLKTVELMHQGKTGALFQAALRAGAQLANAQEWQVAALTEYAQQFGLAFQITDDILDVTGSQEKIGKPVGSDSRNHKATYVTLYSLDEARNMAEQTVMKALQALSKFGTEADVLREMVRSLVNRDN
ncbi:polyprenyl synthetase family protein [Pelosinus sp. sgz500959]|uniref:polyprenyl synthetase family protein n=1 Tax=Pelosinus sp. sgz500959 TaxID=3242472 RepID=UPI00366AF88C